MESDAQLVTSEFSIKVFDCVQIRRHTCPLNHFQTIFLKKCNALDLDLDHCNVGKMHIYQGHRVMVVSALSIQKSTSVNSRYHQRNVLPDNAHAAPHKDIATTMFHCRHHEFFFVLLTFVTSYTIEAISSKNIYLHLIIPEHRVTVVFLDFSTGPLLQERFPSRTTPFHAIFLQCTPYCVMGNTHPLLAFYFFLSNCSDIAH
ncbi:uncharacterized protein [Ranitomeya imitator]|uniref:uncharacterized protein n=1 Tax=Ranitomeya imitator TaxID=111125 RepID=UPI0037E742C7